MFQISREIQTIIDNGSGVAIAIGKSPGGYSLIAMANEEVILFETTQHSVKECFFQLGVHLRATR